MKKILISLSIAAIITGIYFFNSGLFTRVFVSASQIADNIETAVSDKKNIEYENAYLKTEVSMLYDKFSQFSGLRAENQRLRELLKISESENEFTAMRVIAYGENSDYERIFADAGRDKGIKTGQTVVYSGGFAGIVNEVGENWCSINTLMSDDVKISVTDTKTKKTYLLNGKSLEVSYIDSSDNAEAGDIFVASGLSENIPHALNIGTLSLEYNNNGTVKSAKIELPKGYFDIKYLLAVTA